MCLPWFKSAKHQVQPVVEPHSHAPPEIRKIADALVVNNFITSEEAAQQVGAVNDFFSGKISYAEMRMRAG